MQPITEQSNELTKNIDIVTTPGKTPFWSKARFYDGFLFMPTSPLSAEGSMTSASISCPSLQQNLANPAPNQISALSKSCYSHIRQLRCIRPYLDLKTASTIATSIVHSELDYCNSLYFKWRWLWERLYNL